MGISVELSLYPLNVNYKSMVLDFVARLRTYSELTVQTNNMSSQVFGDYDTVMPILQKEIKTCFERPEMVVVVLKLVSKNLED